MSKRLLILGYGNPGRLDDGLGPACIEALRQYELPGVTLEADYQLTVEDAALAAEHQMVVFVDATVAGQEPFELREILPAETLSFSSHAVEPGAVVALAQSLFGAGVQAFALAIRGYEFNEFGESLSEPAQKNLAAAVDFLSTLARINGLPANLRGAT